MDIQNVIKILNKELDASISSEYYSRIERWRQWWAGYTDAFHRYTELCADGKSKKRDIYSLRMAKKICEDWASVLLNEKTEIIVDDKASQEFLVGESGYGGILADIGFWQEANELVEKAFYSGTGAFVLKVDGLNAVEDGRVEKSPDARIRMEYLPAHCIVPLSRHHGDITEVAFVSETTVLGKPYVYLETHMIEDAGYVISNRYYEVRDSKLYQVDLPDGIAARFTTGSPYPFFSIIRPNMVNPYENNLGLGCAVFSQAIDALKGVDLAFNNFCRDFQLGGKKVFYNRELTKLVGHTADGEPMYIAPDDMMQQLFVSIGDEMLDGKTLVHEFNPSLRVSDNRDGLQSQLDYLSFRCGLGTRHYRFDESNNSVTATQYTGEKQEFRQNAAKHGIIVERAVRSIMRSLLWVGKHMIGAAVNPEAGIVIEFSDGYIISDEEKRAQDVQDIRDGLMQPWEYRVKWYGEDESTAKAMTQVNASFGEREYEIGEDGI